VNILTDYLAPALAVPGAAAILAALLPRPAEGSRFAPVFRLLDLLAANWINARNAKP
jgi:hypothetical protein